MKKAFISGGTSGLGLALAEVLLKNNWMVGICGRDLSKIPSEFLQSYSNLYAYQVDVNSFTQLKQSIDQFAPEGLDLVVANAGISLGSSHGKIDWKLGRSILETNIFGVYNMIEAAADKMMFNFKGKVIIISSVAGMVGLPGASSYSASKAALIQMSESLFFDFKKYNITVSCVCPGYIDTPLTRKNKFSMPFLMSAEKAAHLIYRKTILKDMPHLIFPFRMKLIMVILKIIPRSIYRQLIKVYQQKIK